jgi:hypothetical protein
LKEKFRVVEGMEVRPRLCSLSAGGKMSDVTLGRML